MVVRTADGPIRKDRAVTKPNTRKSPRLRRLYNRAAALAERLGPIGAPVFDDDGTFGVFEHLCHELAHAFILNIEPGPGFSGEIEKTLKTFSPDKAIENEAEAWAVEWYALSSVGAPFEWGDVVEGAAVQGCDEADVAAFLTPERKRLGEQLIDYIEVEAS